MRRLADAINGLAADGPYIADALCEYLLTLRPVARERRLSDQQERFLIESGEFTADELAVTKKRVDAGSLQLGAAQAFLSHLSATMSFEDTAGFLGRSDEELQSAVDEGRLYAVEIAGRLRFPVWQLNLKSTDKVLPELPRLLAALDESSNWQSVAAFMATPQESLNGHGPQTPVGWLVNGNSFDSVREIIEARLWR